MHLLFSHLESQLDFYGMIGLFLEDSMESIHALVNQLSHVSGWRSTDSFGGMSYYCYEWKINEIMTTRRSEYSKLIKNQ